MTVEVVHSPAERTVHHQEKVQVGAVEGSLITSLPKFIFKVFTAGVIPRLLK